MSTFGRRQAGIERPSRRRSPRTHFSDLGDRFTKAFPTQQFPTEIPEEDVLARFPIVRQGYDCLAVDEHIAALERELTDLDQELADLRAQAPVEGEVKAEIHRIGEQTSTILLAAHDKAQETTRRAQAEADRCVADAAANALSITEDANRQLRDIEREMGTLARQRELLVHDVRGIATSLSALADEAKGKFDAEPAAVSPVMFDQGGPGDYDNTIEVSSLADAGEVAEAEGAIEPI